MNGPITSGDEEEDGIYLESHIMSYDEFKESRDMNQNSKEIPLYSLLILLVIIIVIMIGSSAIVCFTDDTCKDRIPTTTNMLNSTFTSAFLVTGMNAALAAHGIVVAGIFYRAKHRSHAWASAQVIIAVFVHASACISIFVASKTGWNQDWANVSTILALALWMICVQFALRAVYRDRIAKQRNLLRASLVVFILYTIVCIIYVVLRAVPVDKYVNEKSKQVGILVSEILTAITLVAYNFLTVLHTRHVRLSIFYKPKK